jgi:signal transduction histidine kinase
LPLLLVIPAIGFVLVYLLETQVLLANLSGELTRQAFIIAGMAGEISNIWYDPSSAKAFVGRITPGLNAELMLLDASGHLLYSSNASDQSLIGTVINIPIEHIRYSIPDPDNLSNLLKSSAPADVYVPVVDTDNNVIGYVRLVDPLTNYYPRFFRFREIILVVSGAGLILGILLGTILATELAKPIKAATQAAYQLADGKKMDRLEENGPEEVRLLLRAFNTMIERLDVMEENRQRLLANLVHELGRPLGGIQSAIHALSHGASDDPALRTELLTGIDGELARLERLIEELSHLYGQSVGTLELRKEKVIVSDWLNNNLSTWRENAKEKKLDWVVDTAENLPEGYFDPDLISQALGNLLSNAIRYTPSGGKITVHTHLREDDPNVLELDVVDTGYGVPAEEKDVIFKPFFRGSNSKRFSKGMGLGLSIARDLVVAHGGSLDMESFPGHGSRFTINLPVDQKRTNSDKNGLTTLSAS